MKIRLFFLSLADEPRFAKMPSERLHKRTCCFCRSTSGGALPPQATVDNTWVCFGHGGGSVLVCRFRWRPVCLACQLSKRGAEARKGHSRGCWCQHLCSAGRNPHTSSLSTVHTVPPSVFLRPLKDGNAILIPSALGERETRTRTSAGHGGEDVRGDTLTHASRDNEDSPAAPATTRHAAPRAGAIRMVQHRTSSPLPPAPSVVMGDALPKGGGSGGSSGASFKLSESLGMSVTRAMEHASSDAGEQLLLPPVSDLALEEEIRAALTDTIAQESEVEVQLEALLNAVAVSAATRSDSVRSVAQSLDTVAGRGHQLVRQLKANASTARTVSQHVRELDLLVTRVQASLSCIQDIIELRKCAELLQAALDRDDIQAACVCSRTFLRLKQSDSVENGEAYTAVAQLTAGLETLVQRIRSDAKQLMDQDHIAPIATVIQIASRFESTGLLAEGIAYFGSYVQRAVKLESDIEIERCALLQPSFPKETAGLQGADLPHVVAMTSLFEIVASYAVESEEGLLETFGAHAVIQIAQKLQEQCDGQAKLILESYTAFRSLHSIADMLFSGSVIPRDLDPLLDEIAIISQRTTAYFDFLRQRTIAATTLQTGSANSGAVNGGAGDRDVGSGNDRAAQQQAGGQLIQSPALSPPTGTPKSPLQRTLSSPSSGNEGHSAGLGMDTLQQKELLDEGERFDSLLRNSRLSQMVLSLSEKYTLMEGYFMRENILKAIEIDDAPLPGAPRFSSAVDDIFFVFQKCVRRAVSYASTETLCSVVSIINSVMASDVLSFVQHRLQETNKFAVGGPSGTSSGIRMGGSGTKSLLSGASGMSNVLYGGGTSTGTAGSAKGGSLASFPPAKYGFSVALNNALMSSEYALKLRAGIERDAASVLRTARDRTQLAQVLSEVSEHSRFLARAGEDGMDQLVNTLTGRLPNAIAAMNRIHYLLDEKDYSHGFDSSDEFVQTFIDEMELRVLKGLEEKLIEANWDSLVRRLAEWTSRRLEALILPASAARTGSGTNSDSNANISQQRGLRFSSLGALRFDRDIRALSSYFSTKTRRVSIRDVFARLSQVALLVNLEKPQEIYDLWGTNAGGMTWRLTPSEVRRTLALRVDFSADTIKALKL
ncbi:Conserved oligomeric Golgi complex subunit 4 [Porphyridium purpureum]|uniref:Conserved oligomeric Golgi complex subunit 4 n=1 Tax=Porphyridium purpureum TaxID=35688 RepID=A0A5J4YLB1_PORPP|nr:Conserved oligomeric Golgi complex subunit 4 [Porphyridium purpureum]|eukprot:POR8311..scf249_10